MNKAKRHELKLLKYRKRLKQLNLKETLTTNYYSYKSHGKPCSCYLCRDKKYRDTLRQSNKITALNQF